MYSIHIYVAVSSGDLALHQKSEGGLVSFFGFLFGFLLTFLGPTSLGGLLRYCGPLFGRELFGAGLATLETAKPTEFLSRSVLFGHAVMVA